MPVQLRQITNTFCDRCDLLFSFEEKHVMLKTISEVLPFTDDTQVRMPFFARPLNLAVTNDLRSGV